MVTGQKFTVTTNKDKNPIKKLSIQVSLNGLSFCILNQDTREISFFKKVTFDKQLDPVKILDRIEAIYEQETELQESMHEVVLLFNNPLFSLVPNDLFTEDNAASYLKFNTRILKTDFIAFDKLERDIVIVYIPYTNIINYFFDKYGEFEYKHSLSVLIESLLAQPGNSKGPTVYLHTHSNNYQIVVIENGKLLFANSFEYDTKEDFLYYLLFTAEQLNLDPQVFDLILLGDIDQDSPEYKLAWEYIRNISFLGPFHSYSFNPLVSPKDEISDYLLIKSL